MNPFEFARIAFDTRHWTSDEFEDHCVHQVVIGAGGLVVLLTTYMAFIANVSPMLGGGAWYAATAAVLPTIFLAFELVVPILSDRPPWTVAVLGLLITPGFLAIWIPWFSFWAVWRVIRAHRVQRVRARWIGYWRLRRERRVPRAIARRESSES